MSLSDCVPTFAKWKRPSKGAFGNLSAHQPPAELPIPLRFLVPREAIKVLAARPEFPLQRGRERR